LKEFKWQATLLEIFLNLPALAKVMVKQLDA
jgi:hypothetical protein